MSTSAKKNKYFLTTDEYHKYIATCKSNIAIRVISTLIHNIEWDMSNCVYINTKAMASELDTSTQVIRRSFRMLIEDEAVIRVKNGFMVNPYFVFIGSSEKNKATCARWHSAKQ